MAQAIKKNAPIKRADAERAAVHYAIHEQRCIITRRAIKTQFQSVDFFACDVVGKLADGTHIYVQVTAGQSQAVRDRKKKLEEIPWHSSDIVLLLQLVQTPDPVNARKKKWFFRVFEYWNRVKNRRDWDLHENAVDVPNEWFKANKKKKETI